MSSTEVVFAKEWFRMTHKERVENIYDNHTLAEFWRWWTHGRANVMEVRIKDKVVMRAVTTRFRLPYSASGVYVSNHKELHDVVAFVRKRCTVWFGINPKRKVPNSKKMFVFTGKNAGIDSVSHILIDIDRTKKEGAATTDELERIDAFSKLVINGLVEMNITDYCKIFSGNGIQLLVRIDEPLVLPSVKYDAECDGYVYDEEFISLKDIVKRTLGKTLLSKFNTNENQKIYGCSIDPLPFNIGRVGALPYTFNMKHDEPIMRGILGYGDGENDGLAESMQRIYAKQNAQYTRYSRNRSSPLYHEFNHSLRTLHKSPLVRMLLTKRLPEGQRNSHLIFPLKLLIKDNGIDFNDPAVVALKHDIERVQGGAFDFNSPKDSDHFNSDVVNHYCIDNGLPLCYPPLVEYPTKRTIPESLEMIPPVVRQPIFNSELIKFEKGTTLYWDLRTIPRFLDGLCIDKFDAIIAVQWAFVQKYGEKEARRIWKDYGVLYATK